MKILEEELVLRYHVEYDEAETNLLKKIGFIPPYAATCARLWLTEPEVTAGKVMLEKAKERKL